MRNKISLMFGIVFLLSGMIGLVSAIEYGSNWDKNCNGNLCQVNVYSYEKYWNGNNGWEEIDESFSDCSADGRTRYCTEDYRFRAIADDNGTVSAFIGSEEFTVRLNELLGRNVDFIPRISENMISYDDIIPGVDLVYTYLPNMFKEEIVINEPLQGLPDRDFDITFTKRGNADFGIRDSIICDANGLCQDLEHSVEGNQIIVTIPVSFLNHKDVVYPVTIDPTIDLGDTSIAWDGYVYNESGTPNTYTRVGSPVNYISLGNILTLGGTRMAKGDIDWNVSSIPDGSVVYNLSLQIYVDTASTGTPNVTLNISHMNGNNLTYEDNSTECYGNCQFWEDMADGTLYYSETFASDVVKNIDLDLAISDFEGSLDSDVFSVGFDGHYQVNKDVRIGSKNNPNLGYRPVLTVVYGVNGTDSDAAIEEGIFYSVVGGVNPIYNNQQIYLVNELGTHYTGTFDKAVEEGNQMWIFNYVIPGESFINMPSLFNILNVWENQSLSYSEIVEQVKSYINGTIY